MGLLGTAVKSVIFSRIVVRITHLRSRDLKEKRINSLGNKKNRHIFKPD